MTARPGTIFLLCALLLPPSARAEDDDFKSYKGILKTCASREANQSAALKKLDDKTAQGCKDQIKKSLTECFKYDEHPNLQTLLPDAGSTPLGLAGSQSVQLAAYAKGQMNSSDYASICSDEAEKMAKACDEALQGLDAAKRDNTAKENDADEAAKKTTPGTPAAQQSVSAQANFEQTRNELDKQFKSTKDAKAAADKALQDQTVCYVNLTRVYASAVNDTQSAFAATGAQPKTDDQDPAAHASQVADKDGFKEAAGIKGKEVGMGLATEGGSALYSKFAGGAASTVAQTVASDEGATAAGGVGSTLMKASGAAFVPVNLASGRPREAVTGAMQTAADFMMTPTNAIRFNGLTLAAVLITAPSPLGHCDTPLDYQDPVVAYNAGCKVTTYGGARSNEAAIQSLSGH